MSRWLFLASTAFSLVACSPDDDHEHHPGPSSARPACAAYTTCGTCTPVLGCGWCTFEDGSGKCASGPSACGSTFRWNWEPPDCPGVEPASDAGVTDAAPEVEAADTGSGDAASDAPVDAADAPECRAPSTFTAGCARTTGSALCSSTQYSVGCHASGGAVPGPDTALGCTRALATSTSAYYCCPCLP